MSRVSITKRLAAIRAAMQSYDDYGYRLHHLSPRLRSWHDDWKAECQRIGDEYGNAYQAMIEGKAKMPPMPHHVAQALGLNIQKYTIRTDATLTEAAEIYCQCLMEE